MPTLPLRLRNRLAATILAALHEAPARRELVALARGEAVAGWLEAGEAGWTEPLTWRARAASTALADRPLLSPDADLCETLSAAAPLFDSGLFFEVHELLEPHWLSASGETRDALQGLIQVAVAWQHLANGNLAGARSLLAEGSGRLHGARLLGVHLDPFARAAAEAGARLADGLPTTPMPFPRITPDVSEDRA